MTDEVRDARRMNVNQQKALKLRKDADYLDKVWRDCRVASAVGSGTGLVGGLLTIGAGVVTALFGEGTASLLVFTGIAMGATEAAINVGTSYIESSINSSQVEEAAKVVRDARDSAQKVMDTIERMKSRARFGKMIILVFLASGTLELELKDLLKQLHYLYAQYRSSRGSLVEIGEIGTTITQTAEQASSKVGGKTLRNIMVGASAAFVVLDALSLGFTIRDLIQGKKSEAAKRLRQKATEIRS